MCSFTNREGRRDWYVYSFLLFMYVNVLTFFRGLSRNRSNRHVYLNKIRILSRLQLTIAQVFSFVRIYSVWLPSGISLISSTSH